MPIFSFAQYFGMEGISDSTRQANKLYKCTEYNVEDSVTFFKEYKNGYYHIYDFEGKVIERNAYGVSINETEDWVPHEFTIFTIYDDKDRQIMEVYYDTLYLNKIKRIRTNEYDSVGNLYGYRDFSSDEKSPKAYEIKKLRQYEYPEPVEIIDSTITDTKKTFYHFLKEDRIDTVEFTTYYYSENRVDSIVSFFNKKNHSPILKQYFTYNEIGALKQYECKSYDHTDSLKRIYRTLYIENGFPIEKWYIYYDNGEKEITHTRFRYEYYKPSEQ